MSDIEELENNQQEILQTLNNGLKSKVEENYNNMKQLESRFNKLLLAMGGGMFAIIMMLVQILVKLGGS